MMALSNGGKRYPPAVILGGGANSLSVARSLRRLGVKVLVLNLPDTPVRYSRYASWLEVPCGNDPEGAWSSWLCGKESDWLSGAVVLAASDVALMILLKHRDSLKRKFILDVSDPQSQLAMLNKLETYRTATRAGVDTPKYWAIESTAELDRLRSELVYPLLVKPRFSHIFESRFGRKFLIANSEEEAKTALQVAENSGIEVLLMELIPGPDNLLCSYYTYLDKDGRAHFDFTKRVIRRYPVGMGTGCYHVTDWMPEVRDEALKLFRETNLRGLANAEFKRDPRDGRLKLIECNARFTAATRLLADSGMDLAAFVYLRLIGENPKMPTRFRSGIRLWDPIQDMYAYRQLRARGEINFAQWLGSILRPQRLAWLYWDDPLPGIIGVYRELRQILARRLVKPAPTCFESSGKAQR